MCWTLNARPVEAVADRMNRDSSETTPRAMANHSPLPRCRSSQPGVASAFRAESSQCVLVGGGGDKFKYQFHCGCPPSRGVPTSDDRRVFARGERASNKMGSLEQVRRLANIRDTDPSRFPSAYLELKVRQTESGKWLAERGKESSQFEIEERVVADILRRSLQQGVCVCVCACICYQPRVQVNGRGSASLISCV